MKISVITPTLNSIKTIHRTFSSLARDAQYISEWIVVDSGSTDGTVEFVQGCDSTLFKIIMISSSPLGPYDAMNRGVLSATGDVVSILNSDDAWTCGVAKGVLDVFFESGADIVFGRIKYIGDDGSYSLVGDASFDNLNTFRMNLVHPSVFVARRCYEEIGCFNLKYPISADLEWLLKAKLKGGYQFRYSDNIVVEYYYGGLSSRKSEGLLSYCRMYYELHPPLRWLAYSLARYIYGSAKRVMIGP